MHPFALVFRAIVGRTAVAFVALIISHFARADFSFVPGDYYTTNLFSRVITQRDAAGVAVGTYTLPTTTVGDFRGLTFGPDGLLYAAVSRGSAGFAILALQSDGSVAQSYFGGVYLAGNTDYGKIAVDRQYLYITGQDQLVRFVLGQPLAGSAVIYSSSQVFDIKALPNGNLFVTSYSAVNEISNNGAPIRSIFLTSPGGERFNDIRAIEYDPFTDKLYAAQLGYSGFTFPLMRINAATGELENRTTFTYGSDMFVDISGNLLVGSSSQAPTLFNAELAQLGILTNEQQEFVTRLLPWPTLEGISSAPIVAEATSAAGAAVIFASATSSDFEGNPNLVVNLPASGSVFPIGTTNVVATAVDRQSHTTTATFPVTVQDTTPPVIPVPTNIIRQTKSKRGATVIFSVSAHDVVDGDILSVGNPASGSFFPIGDTVVTVTATDSHGNVASPQTFTVSIVAKKKHS